MVKRVHFELGIKNREIVEDRRDPNDHLVQYSAQSSQLGEVTQDHVQLSFEYLQGQRVLNPSQQIVPVFDYHYSKKAFFSLMFKQNFLYFTLCPLPLVHSLCITEKSLVQSSFCTPIQYLYILVRSSLSLLMTKQSL